MTIIEADPNYQKVVSIDEFVVTGGNGDVAVDRSMPAQTYNSVPAGTTYVVNTNTGKFHNPDCDSVKDMI